MSDAPFNGTSEQNTRKVESHELIHQIKKADDSPPNMENDDCEECNVGDEFNEENNDIGEEEKNSRKHAIQTPQSKMHCNNLGVKNNNAKIRSLPEKDEEEKKIEPIQVIEELEKVENNEVNDLDERPQNQGSGEKSFVNSGIPTGTFNKNVSNDNSESQISKNSPKEPPKFQYNQKKFDKISNLDCSDISLQRPCSKVEHNRTKSNVSKSKNSSKSRLEEYEKILNNGLSDAVDVSLSAAKEEYYKNSENTIRSELHKIRLKNAELRLSIENTKKEKETLSKEIEKIRMTVARAEKARENVFFVKFYEIGCGIYEKARRGTY